MNTPLGIEVLVKKAAVDAEFKALLLADPVAAAGAIGLELDPAEAMMLRAVSIEQLTAIIDRTEVPEEHRRAFLGQAAAAMLAVLGLGSSLAVAGGIASGLGGSLGIMPDQPPMSGLGGMRGDYLEPSQPPAKKESPPKKTVSTEMKIISLLTDRWRLKRGEAAGPKRLVEDLKADDKKLADLKTRLERMFGIKISQDEWQKVSTVSDVVKLVDEKAPKTEAKQPAPPMSRGIQPDRPQGWSGGMRPH